MDDVICERECWMRIYGANGAQAASVRGSSRRTGRSGTAFSIVQDDGGVGQARQNSQLSNVQDVGALLALQAVEDGGQGRKRKAVRRGHKLLDLLESIRLGLLSGQVPREVLQQLERLSEGFDSCGDGRIDDVIAEIELRAQVELEKLRHANMSTR